MGGAGADRLKILFPFMVYCVYFIIFFSLSFDPFSRVKIYLLEEFIYRISPHFQRLKQLLKYYRHFKCLFDFSIFEIKLV